MNWSGLWRFIRAAAITFTALIAIPTAFIALRDANLEWQFYALAVVALLMAAVLLYGSLGRMWIQQIKNYPTLLARIADLQSENLDLVRQQEALGTEVEAAWDRGVVEGENRIYGALIANSADVPVPVAVVDHLGTVAFLCDETANQPAEGARYLVVAQASRQTFGMVEATRFDQQRLCLVCVQVVKSRFWERLANRIEYDDRMPEGVELTNLTLSRSANEIIPAIITQDDHVSRAEEGETDG